MAWFRVDDHLYHTRSGWPPARAPGRYGPSAGSWSAGQPVDGYVPATALRIPDGTGREADDQSGSGMGRPPPRVAVPRMDRVPADPAQPSSRSAAGRRPAGGRDRKDAQRDERGARIRACNAVTWARVTHAQPSPAQPPSPAPALELTPIHFLWSPQIQSSSKDARTVAPSPSPRPTPWIWNTHADQDRGRTTRGGGQRTATGLACLVAADLPVEAQGPGIPGCRRGSGVDRHRPADQDPGAPDEQGPWWKAPQADSPTAAVHVRPRCPDHLTRDAPRLPLTAPAAAVTPRPVWRHAVRL